MLPHPTFDQLSDLGLHGMAKALREMQTNREVGTLSHEEWLGVLLDHEVTLRRQKRFEARAKSARLRHPAVIEDVDFRAPRGLDRALFQRTLPHPAPAAL